MSVYVYFDSGTTNARAYLVQNGEVQATLTRQIGTVDNVLSGDGMTLTRGLKKLYDQILGENRLSDREVEGIYMSGMATSKNGVHEVGFLPIPMDIATYSKQIHMWQTPIFERPVGYFTGLVCLPDGVQGNINNVEQFHNVRGEEIELLGIMEMHPECFLEKNTAVIMPGSHTHILYADNKEIVEITSCMGGELYGAMAKNTILSASVSERPEIICGKGLKKGYNMVDKFGMNRALYITRTLDLFTDEDIVMRNSYLEGVVNADIVKALKCSQRAETLDGIVVAGNPVYYRIFKELIRYADIGVPVTHITQKKEASFALSGFLSIMAKDGRHI